MKFKLDENLPREASALFRKAGHDALTVADQRLSGAETPRSTTSADRNGALEVDFANVQAYPPGQSSGLIVLRLKEQSQPAVLSAIGSVLSLLQHEPVNGRLWIVEEQRIRIRT